MSRGARASEDAGRARTVYADYAAAAPLRPRAAQVLTNALTSGFGNPSSAHAAGRRARALLESAREELAAALGVHPLELVFTSGATEANNLALLGTAAAAGGACRLAAPATEHASVLEPLRMLARRGHAVATLPVDPTGGLEPAAVRAARPDLLAVALANAETGRVQDVAALADAAHAGGGRVHVDAAQAAVVLPIAPAAFDADLMTLSGCKVGGPCGTGALWVRAGAPLVAVAGGGPQEQGLRPGTENVAAAAAFAAAFADTVAERAAEARRLEALGTRLRAALPALWSGARLASGPTAPHLVHVILPGLEGEDVVAALDLEGVAAATGSACAAGAAEPSHVILAMGGTPAEARSTLRVSLGWRSTDDDVGRILAALATVLGRARAPRRDEAWTAHASS